METGGQERRTEKCRTSVMVEYSGTDNTEKERAEQENGEHENEGRLTIDKKFLMFIKYILKKYI